MPQFRPRPSVGGFRQAQGADIGRAISGVGGVLGGIAEGQQRAELQDIAFQEELDRAQQIQVENLDKSEVLKQKSIKQRARLDEISRIEQKALETGDYSPVLDELQLFDEDYDRALLENASPGFQRLFPIADAPAKAGKMNQMATTQAAGNMQVLQSNYAATLQSEADNVTPDMTPAEIVEDFDDAALGATSYGFQPGVARDLADQAKAGAMQEWIMGQPIENAIAALKSDPNVRKALDSEQINSIEATITSQKNRYEANAETYGAASEIALGTNLNDMAQDSTQLEMNAVINQSTLDDAGKQEWLEFSRVLQRNKAENPTGFTSVQREAEAVQIKGAIAVSLERYNEILEDETIPPEDKEEELRDLAQKVTTQISKGSLKVSKNEMNPDDLQTARFSARPILTDAMNLMSEVEPPEKPGFFEVLNAVTASVWNREFDGVRKRLQRPSGDTNAAALVSQYRSDMLLGNDPAINFPAQAQAFMGSRLVLLTLEREAEMSQLATKQEAEKLKAEIVQQAQLEYVQEHFPGLKGDDIDAQVKRIFDPTSEPQVTASPLLQGIATDIQSNLGDFSREEIRSAFINSGRATGDQFDQAFEQVSSPDIALPEVDNQRSFANTLGATSDPGVEFIKNGNPESEFRGERLELTAYRDVGGKLTVGYGHTGPDVTPGMVITEEEADRLLVEDLKEAEGGVQSIVPNWEKLEEGEFNTLVSLVFNVGADAVGKSDAIAALNRALEGEARNPDDIEEFLFEAFDAEKGFVRANGEIVKGLVRRRAAERAMFEGA